MKEKVLFIAAIIGSFSATIILLITQVLVIAGVDTSGYIDIINMVGVALAAIILIVAVFFLNKYNVIQHATTIEQRGIVNTALDNNATLLETILPKLATNILSAAEERSNRLLQIAETNLTNMMTEMLPQLAEQTMQLVTEKSQNIVNETTAKAEAVMKTMDELIPTYAKQISDSVAQTVRENNAHYHKMLTELKGLYTNMNSAAANSTPITPMPTIEDIAAIITANFDKLDELILVKLNELMYPAEEPVVEEPVVEEPVVEEPVVEEPVVEEPEDVFTIDTSTQSDEELEKSDESNTE